MTRSLHVILLAGLGSLSAGLVLYGQETSPRAIVDKAIKAHGGEANLAKFPAYTAKGTGNFYGLGEGIPYDGEWFFQGGTQQSFMVESKVNNMTFKFLRVVNGDKGWIKLNDGEAMNMSKDELAEEQELLFASTVTRLYALKDKSFELAVIGEAKVGEKPAIGIRVSKKGHRDISLYFDRQSHLLLKSERPAKDVKAGQEYIETTLLDGYKAFKGVQHATKVVIQKDGKRLVDVEMTDYQPLEKLDATVFKRP